MTSSSPGDKSGARAVGVEFGADRLHVELKDGRRISVPLGWYPRLLGASAEEREAWELLGDGVGIRWPLVDEDLSVAGILAGRVAPGGSKRVG